MCGWTGRTKLSVLLSVVAIGLAACAGSGGSSRAVAALKPYVDAVPKALAPYTAAAKAVGASPTDAASWDQSSQTAKQAAETINRLTAPAGLQSQQQALAASLSHMSDADAKIATDLKNNDSSTLKTDLGPVRAANVAYLAAAAAWSRVATAKAKNAVGSSGNS